MLFKKTIQHASDEFVSDTRKNAHANVLTRKYVIMNRNKYIHDFWKTVFFGTSAKQLHMGKLNMIICHRRAQLKNKEIILHLTKKKSLLGPTRSYFRILSVF